MKHNNERTVGRQRLLGIAAALVMSAGASSGCSATVDTTPAVTIEPALPPVLSGSLVLSWSIDGVQDPNECVKAVTTTIQVNVTDLNGVVVGTFVQACEAFSTSITLEAGTYAASAALLDGYGQPRTTSVFIDPFTLLGNDVLDVVVDFPASSFL